MLVRCTRCLMPTSRPDTAFVDGICTACIHYDAQQKVDWKRRKNDLTKLFDRQKPNETGYDCIVASSGGKDSHAQVLSLLELGVKPLLVTATTCMLTELGRYNIENLCQYAKTLQITYDEKVRATLNYLGLTLVGDVSWPEHVSIFTAPVLVAIKYEIPLIFYGENPQAQYGGPAGAEKARQMTRRWVNEFGGFLGLRPMDLVGQLGLTEHDMQAYEFPATGRVKRAKCEAHFLGQYLGPWDSRKNADIAIAAGMKFELPAKCNWWEFENLDNGMTGLHDWMMYKKYGYGRACAQLSVDIRFGRITRDEAITILLEREGIFPSVYAGVPFTDVLDRLHMTMDEMQEVIDKFTTTDEVE